MFCLNSYKHFVCFYSLNSLFNFLFWGLATIDISNDNTKNITSNDAMGAKNDFSFRAGCRLKNELRTAGLGQAKRKSLSKSLVVRQFLFLNDYQKKISL